MASLLCTIQFWSQKPGLQIDDFDIACNAYHEKVESGGDQSYYEDKKNYFESRGRTWILSNKRPEKLRDALREFEEFCLANRCIKVEWKNQFLIQAIFGNGTFVNLLIDVSTGDIEKLSFDKHLVSKLHSDHVVDVAFDEDSFFFSFVEPKLNRLLLNKKPTLLDDSRKIEKLNSFDPKVSALDLLGPAGRRLERKLSINVNNDFLLVWWRISSNEVSPWTPLTTEKERANLQVYNINGARFELACYCRTDMEPLTAAFSKTDAHHIITLEQKLSHSGEIIVERCIYEVTMTKLQRIASTSIPARSQVLCQAHNSQEDRLLIGCENCSLLLFDDYRRMTHTTKISFVPAIIAWHPNDTAVIVGSEFGQIQCFDQALSCIKLQLLSDEDPQSLTYLDLSRYFKQQPVLQKLVWNPAKTVSCSDFLSLDKILAVFDRGPFVAIQFQLGIFNRNTLSPVELTSQFIKHRQIDEAVNLLSSLNWNTDAQLCYYCLTLIVNRLLRMPFNATVDSQLEAALGTFYAPIRPLTKVIILEYRDRLVNLARKFFHHLLRHDKLEKASLLAVDIGSRDLFRDLYYVAESKGDNIMAEVALRNAKELEEGSITSDESGDSVDESDDSSEYSESSYSSDLSEASRNRKLTTNVTVKDKHTSHTKSRNHITSKREEFQFVSPAELKIQPAIKVQPAKQPLPRLINSAPLIKSAAIVPTTVERQSYMHPTQRIPPSKPVAIHEEVDSPPLYYPYTQLTASTDLSLLSLKPEVEANSSVLDPNEQLVDGDILPGASDDDDDEATGTVKVVHFGIV